MTSGEGVSAALLCLAPLLPRTAPHDEDEALASLRTALSHSAMRGNGPEKLCDSFKLSKHEGQAPWGSLGSCPFSQLCLWSPWLNSGTDPQGWGCLFTQQETGNHNQAADLHKIRQRSLGEMELASVPGTGLRWGLPRALAASGAAALKGAGAAVVGASERVMLPAPCSSLVWAGC